MEVPSATASAKDTKADGGSTPKVSNKEKLKTADMAGLGHLDPRTGKKWDTTLKTSTPKVKKGVV